MPKSRKTQACPVEVTLRVVAGRWKALLLHHLLEGTSRFNQLHRKLPEATPRTLAKHLRELERDGIVRRKAFAEIPPRVEYSLTRLGRSLEPVLLPMHDWGDAYSHRLPPLEG